MEGEEVLADVDEGEPAEPSDRGGNWTEQAERQEGGKNKSGVAMRWREVLEAPKIQVREGKAQNAAVGPRASVARVRRFCAGRMPSDPYRPGIWGRRERKAKK